MWSHKKEISTTLFFHLHPYSALSGQVRLYSLLSAWRLNSPLLNSQSPKFKKHEINSSLFNVVTFFFYVIRRNKFSNLIPQLFMFRIFNLTMFFIGIHHEKIPCTFFIHFRQISLLTKDFSKNSVNQIFYIDSLEYS